MTERFDYVIVGAGSAGCVLAERLSADPNIEVLLLEAGGRDRNPMIHVPKGFGKLMGNASTTWHFETQPVAPSGKREQWARGRTLGGSSAINGMIYNRGSRADYDELVRLGNRGWGWDTMLPIFKLIEDHGLGGSPVRGAGGPLHISTGRDRDVLCDEVIAAGAKLGMTTPADLNETDDERIGYSMATIKNGRRFSAARAFLHPAKRRPNLTVLTNHWVTKVEFEGDKAVGVRARHGSSSTEFRASREVILSLGSLQTPRLLQLSGIGPDDVLRAAGIDIRLDRPTLGARMREHRCFNLQFRLKENLGYNRHLATSGAQALSGLRYLATRHGPLAAPSFDVVGFLKTRPELERPDGQILMAPFSAAPAIPGKQLGTEREPGVECIGYVLRPNAEGRLRITSADPNDPMDIEPNYFGSTHDRETGVALFRRMRELFEQDPIAARVAFETVPGEAVSTDEAIIEAGLEEGYCGYHAIGTCAMGTSDDDVVDSDLRVRGVDGLRVVDCSIWPSMVSGNLNGPMMAAAWHAADLILDRT